MLLFCVPLFFLLLLLRQTQAPTNRQTIEQREQNLQRERRHDRQQAHRVEHAHTVQQRLRTLHRHKRIGKERRHNRRRDPGRCIRQQHQLHRTVRPVNHGNPHMHHQIDQRHRTNREKRDANEVINSNQRGYDQQQHTHQVQVLSRQRVITGDIPELISLLLQLIHSLQLHKLRLRHMLLRHKIRGALNRRKLSGRNRFTPPHTSGISHPSPQKCRANGPYAHSQQGKYDRSC